MKTKLCQATLKMALLTSICFAGGVPGTRAQTAGNTAAINSKPLLAETSVPFTYSVANGAVTITGYTGSPGAVTIPGAIEGLPVTAIAARAFTGTNITSLSLPSSVTGIDVANGGLFLSCPNLAAIVVDPANPSYSSLDGVLFDKSRKTLLACPPGKRGSYTIPNGVKNIAGGRYWLIATFFGDYGAFLGCNRLIGIGIPNSVTNIGANAFSGCGGLKRLTLPNSVLDLGAAAFAGCPGLTAISIPNSVVRLQERAFAGCTGLTSVTLGSGLTEVAQNAFASCTSLASFIVPALNPNYASQEGVLFNKTKTVLLRFPPAKRGSYAVPGTVVELEAGFPPPGFTGYQTTWPGAFENCVNLSQVTLPNNLTSIGLNVFQGCAALTSVVFPNSLTNIGPAAFASCNGLRNITLPASLKTVGGAAFSGCTNLTFACFQGNAPSETDLWLEIFAGDPNATVYYLPGTIGWGPTFGGAPTTLLAFTYTASKGKITITGYKGPGGDVAIPATLEALPVVSIATNAFAWNHTITSITLPSGIADIGFKAFFMCSGLTNASVPGSVTSLGYYAFMGCVNLVAITVDPQNKAYSSVDGVLFNKNQTTLIAYPGGKPGSYKVPKTVTSIFPAALALCPKLTAIFVDPSSASYSSVGDVLFDKKQTKLIQYPGGRPGTYTVPQTVTSLGDYSFFLQP